MIHRTATLRAGGGAKARTRRAFPESPRRIADPFVSKQRVIKKYPNRRLYDTEVSSYITLDDVRKLVLGQVDFKVVDARSKENITRSILLQIIMEQEEEDGEPIFTEEVLAQMIRFYGDSLQSAMSNFFEKSFRMFVEQQEALGSQVQNMMVKDPLNYMRDLTEKNMAMWREVQDGFFKAAMPSARSSDKDTED
jgi:polyhydroxyalkanoate synthesis repressor PhaR